MVRRVNKNISYFTNLILRFFSSDTIPSTMIFNVTIGTFLPDVQLINVTIGGGVAETVPQVISHGLTLYPIIHTNGSVDFVLKVPFLDQQVFTKVMYASCILIPLWESMEAHCPRCWLVLISGFNLQGLFAPECGAGNLCSTCVSCTALKTLYLSSTAVVSSMLMTRQVQVTNREPALNHMLDVPCELVSLYSCMH